MGFIDGGLIGGERRFVAHKNRFNWETEMAGVVYSVSLHTCIVSVVWIEGGESFGHSVSLVSCGLVTTRLGRGGCTHLVGENTQHPTQPARRR